MREGWIKYSGRKDGGMNKTDEWPHLIFDMKEPLIKWFIVFSKWLIQVAELFPVPVILVVQSVDSVTKVQSGENRDIFCTWWRLDRTQHFCVQMGSLDRTRVINLDKGWGRREHRTEAMLGCSGNQTGLKFGERIWRSWELCRWIGGARWSVLPVWFGLVNLVLV